VKVQRTADPWRDPAVIDSRAPRFNQVVVGIVVALLGALFGWSLAWALMAAQLGLGLAVGRRANTIGTAFLSAAAAAWWLAAPALGTVLAAIVTTLALLAATTGFCAGCEPYKLSARRRGIVRIDQHRLDPADLGPGFAGATGSGSGGLIGDFSHPLCAECLQWERRIESGPERFVERLAP
jgi:hypothetical protein